MWVRPEDPGELAGAVSRLMGDRELTGLLGEKALQMAPFYSREKQARDMLASLAAAAG